MSITCDQALTANRPERTKQNKEQRNDQNQQGLHYSLRVCSVWQQLSERENKAHGERGVSRLEAHVGRLNFN